MRRHVSSRQRLTCRILRRWKKHILAVEETCCVMFSLQSRRTPRSRTTLCYGGQTKSVLFLWHLVSNAGLDVMDACCHFHFSVFEIFATEFYVELSVVSIQVDHEALLRSNVYNVRGV